MERGDSLSLPDIAYRVMSYLAKEATHQRSLRVDELPMPEDITKKARLLAGLCARENPLVYLDWRGADYQPELLPPQVIGYESFSKILMRQKPDKHGRHLHIYLTDFGQQVLDKWRWDNQWAEDIKPESNASDKRREPTIPTRPMSLRGACKWFNIKDPRTLKKMSRMVQSRRISVAQSFGSSISMKRLYGMSTCVPKWIQPISHLMRHDRA